MHGVGVLNSERPAEQQSGKDIAPLTSAQIFHIGLNGSHEAGQYLPSYHHPIDPTATWEYEISSAYHGSIVERVVKPGARPTPSKEGGSIWRIYPTRNQTSGSDPRSCKHPFLRPHKTGTPAVCEQLHLGDSSNRSSVRPRQYRPRSHPISYRNRTG